MAYGKYQNVAGTFKGTDWGAGKEAEIIPQDSRGTQINCLEARYSRD